MVAGIQLYYLVPMIVGPLVAAIGGWVTAWFQYKQQSTSGSGDRLLRFVNELQEELARAERRMDLIQQQLAAARDVLIQLLNVIPEIQDTPLKDKLMNIIREGLRGL